MKHKEYAIVMIDNTVSGARKIGPLSTNDSIKEQRYWHGYDIGDVIEVLGPTDFLDEYPGGLETRRIEEDYGQQTLPPEYLWIL